jgi:polysaccharide biosynthesis protein PslG
MKRLTLGLALLVVLGLASLIGYHPRTELLDRLDLETRHRVVAFLSGLTARRPETADSVPVVPHVDNPLGINTFLEQDVTLEARQRSLEMIHEAGYGWIRQQFPWSSIEPVAKGKFVDRVIFVDTWQVYDSIVDLARANDLQVIARLDTSPPWARPGNDWPNTPPDNLDDYGDFVEMVAHRYRGRVKYYQLWNEPNLYIEWGKRPVDPDGYAALLKVGYERIKRADPDAVVLAASLSPTIEQSDQALNELLYLQRLYDAGAAPYFDVMSVQAYGLRNGPDDRRLDLGDVNFSRPTLVRELMVRNGDAAKAVWASEVGWNSQPESVPAEPTFGRVSDELQARYTVRALERAHDEWPWMGVMNLWFFRRPHQDEWDQPFFYFRMVDPDFTPRPVWWAVREYAHRVGYGSR